MFSANALQLLKARYCMPGEEPTDVFKRVANTLGCGDNNLVDRINDLMLKGIFLPNSPALFNAGYSNMLHACCALGIEDNMESIAKFGYNMQMMFKHGAGVGANYSYLREKDAPLSKGGSSSGVMSLLDVVNKQVDYVKQGGKRRGAAMSILFFWHPEALSFIQAKIKGGLENMNLSIMVTDEFMNAVEKGEDFDIISPKNGKLGKMHAADLFDIIAFCAWSCGCPGLLFFDRINEDVNKVQWPGTIITTTNPCIYWNDLLLDGDCLKPIIAKDATTWTSWETGIKETLELTMNNGLTIRCTPDHNIKTLQGWSEAKYTLGKEIEWGLGNREATDINNDIVLQGFLFGDGFRSANKTGCSVRINKENEFEIYYLLKEYGFKEENCKDMYIARKNLPFDTDFLDRKLPVRNIPDYIMYGNSTICASFLKGLFEANGSCNKLNGQVSFKTTNKKLAQDLQILLASFGIPSWITKNEQQTIQWKNGEYISKESYNLQIAPTNGMIFRDKIGFISERKNKHIRITKNTYRTVLKVAKIENIGLTKVYDFRMNDSSEENFCQGIIVHNCSESPIPNDSLCTLGSINLSKFVRNGEFNFERFADVVEVGEQALLNMNKVGWYPFDFMKEAMDKYNPVGLGVMGFADALIKLEVMYDSDGAIEFINRVGTVYKEVTERVAEGSFYKRIIAPTGSLSILADCSSGIEPVFADVFERNLTVGKIEETRDLYKSKYCRVAHDISPEWHLKIQAAWQQWADGGISKTINMPHDATFRDVRNAYMSAWKNRVKGVTCFRDGSKEEQVLNKIHRPVCSDDTCML